MLPLSLLCAGEKQGSGAEAGRLSVDSVDTMTVRFQGKCGSGYRIARFDEAPSFPATGNMVSIVERIFLVDWFLDFWGASGQVPGFACVLCVRHPIFRGIRRMFPGSIGRALPLAPIGH